jgi:hypothetical protein
MLLSEAAAEGMVLGLEEALLENPEDLFTHRAYADLLFRQRVPAVAARGRFIETQLRLEEPGRSEEEKRKLLARQRKLLKEHGRAWLGVRLARFLLDQEGVPPKCKGYSFELRRGWLTWVQVPILTIEFARILVEAPETRLLRELIVEKVGPEHEEALALLDAASFRDRLRLFRIGEVRQG